MKYQVLYVQITKPNSQLVDFIDSLKTGDLDITSSSEYPLSNGKVESAVKKQQRKSWEKQMFSPAGESCSIKDTNTGGSLISTDLASTYLTHYRIHL